MVPLELNSEAEKVSKSKQKYDKTYQIISKYLYFKISQKLVKILLHQSVHKLA